MIEWDENVLEASWRPALGGEFRQPYMQQLHSFLLAEISKGSVIYPPQDQIFSAFKQTSLSSLKVVILGQDPYHGEGQAHGLSFSVPVGVKTPPSLRNIYRELYTEYGLETPGHGCLSSWAEQGVLLLNSVLTVEANQAASHQGKGWETFTDRVVELINSQREAVVFMLWGAYAQRKGTIIDRERHCVLSAPHPSPLSAHRGFLGCDHFKKANQYLVQQGQSAVNWAPSD